MEVTKRVNGALVASDKITVTHTVVWMQDATIIGNTNPLETPMEYTWETTTQGVNGDYYAEWSLDGDVTSVVKIKTQTNDKCTLEVLNVVTEVVSGTITLKLRKQYDNSIIVTATKTLAAVMEGVVITSVTNPGVQAALYNAGLVANESYSLKEEVEKITADQLQPGTDAATSIFYSQSSNISSFDEFKYFTGVNSIKSYTFYFCHNLTNITIPESVTTIGKGVFSLCSRLTSVTIPNSVTTIGKGVFSLCSRLTSVTIPNSVTTIGETAFYQCARLTSVSIPDSVTSIEQSAFNGCTRLTSVTIGDSVTTIGYAAFSRCSSLTSIIIPDSVTTIREYAFTECSSLISVTIGGGVTTIGDSAFNNCSKLAHIFGGSGLTSVYTSAFIGVSMDVSIEDTFPYSLLMQNVGVNITYKTNNRSGSIYQNRIYALQFGTYTMSVPNGIYYVDGSNSKEIELKYEGKIFDMTNILSIGFFDVSINSNIPDATFNVSYINNDNVNVSIVLGIGTHKLPIKVGSTVKCVAINDYSGYNKPSESSSVASGGITFAMGYEELLGIYIQHIDGTLYSKEEWQSNSFSRDVANGIAIAGMTSREGFVISKNDLGTYETSENIRWRYGRGYLVEGVMSTTSSANAILDMRGYENTEIIAKDPDHRVARCCVQFIFPNGNKGYLPALGELYLVYQNITTIMELMSLIGGSVFSTHPYWSSTQRGAEEAWQMYLNSKNNSSITSYLKNNNIGETRPFTTIEKQ
jgi:hypothetical protein